MNGAMQLRHATRQLCIAVPRRTLRTRAQQEQQQQQGGGQGQQEMSTAVQPQEKGQQQQGAMARREDMPVVPFRRMTEMVDAMQREMDAMTNMMFGNDMGFMMRPFERALPSLMMPSEMEAGSALAPAPFIREFLNVDVQEDDKAYTITADIPGFTKEQVKAKLSPDGVLTLSGESKKEEEQKNKEGGVQRRSSRMTSFTRSFRLPQDAKPEEISANTEHGVLTLRIPKMEMPEKAEKDIPIS